LGDVFVAKRIVCGGDLSDVVTFFVLRQGIEPQPRFPEITCHGVDAVLESYKLPVKVVRFAEKEEALHGIGENFLLLNRNKTDNLCVYN
jgi:hypothetical protein